MKILCYSEKGFRLSLHGLFLVLITMLGKAWGPFPSISKIAPHSIQDDGFFTLVNLIDLIMKIVWRIKRAFSWKIWSGEDEEL